MLYQRDSSLVRSSRCVRILSEAIESLATSVPARLKEQLEQVIIFVDQLANIRDVSTEVGFGQGFFDLERTFASRVEVNCQVPNALLVNLECLNFGSSVQFCAVHDHGTLRLVGVEGVSVTLSCLGIHLNVPLKDFVLRQGSGDQLFIETTIASPLHLGGKSPNHALSLSIPAAASAAGISKGARSSRRVEEGYRFRRRWIQLSSKDSRQGQAAPRRAAPRKIAMHAPMSA